MVARICSGHGAEGRLLCFLMALASCVTAPPCPEGTCADVQIMIPRPCVQVPSSPHLSSIIGGVYLKYNAASGSAYVTEYTGNDRGVLVQLAQQQIGLLPLGLFDEHKTAPSPSL